MRYSSANLAICAGCDQTLLHQHLWCALQNGPVHTIDNNNRTLKSKLLNQKAAASLEIIAHTCGHLVGYASPIAKTHSVISCTISFLTKRSGLKIILLTQSI